MGARAFKTHASIHSAPRWLLTTPLTLALLTGCHADATQGGAPDKNSAKSPAATDPNTRQTLQQDKQPIPTPPTADQFDPSSPRAILGETSTTQPATNPPQPTPPGAPSSRQPHRR